MQIVLKNFQNVTFILMSKFFLSCNLQAFVILINMHFQTLIVLVSMGFTDSENFKGRVGHSIFSLVFWFIMLIKGSLISNTLIYAKLPANTKLKAQLPFHILLFSFVKIG